MKRDIYFEGKIYKDVEMEFPALYESSTYARLSWSEHLQRYNYTSFEVTGSHSFKEGEDVTGKYEKELQIDRRQGWINCTEDWFNSDACNEAILKRIVAVASPTKDAERESERCKGHGHVLNPNDPTDGRTCPECDGAGFIFSSLPPNEREGKMFSLEDMDKCFNEGMNAQKHINDLPTPRTTFQYLISSLNKK